MEVINLNFIPSGATPVAHASQFDEGRTTRFNLFDGSAVYTLDGTEIITVSVRKPDGHIVTESVTNTSSNYVEVVTTEQMTACAGDNLAQIKVEKGGDTIGFLNYILSVQKDPEDGGDPSASFIHDLEQQIADAVEDQYDSNAVIFDAAPTAGHGVGFAVTSEGVKTYVEGEIAALTIPEELDDLQDVELTSPTAGQILEYDDNDGKWKNVANPASTTNFGAPYDENTTYNVPSLVINNNLLYKLNDGEDGTTGPWDPTKWTQTSVAEIAEEIGSLAALTTTDKSSLVGAVNEVVTDKADKSALTWTLLGETTGTAEQSLPANWNELQVYGMFGGNAQYGFVAHAIKAHWGSNPARYIQGGADKDSGTDHHIAVWHIGSNAKIGLDFWRYNNTDYTSTSKLIVYYR